MKAAVLLGAWLSVGAWVALRGPRPPLERALAWLFWPFFLGESGPAPADVEVDPTLARLQRALGEGDAADGVVAELSRALGRLRGRRDRVQSELDALGAGPVGPVGDARARSRALLEAALARIHAELGLVEAAIEETATRLVLSREGGGGAEVGPLLDALRGRLAAAEELDPGLSAR